MSLRSVSTLAFLTMQHYWLVIGSLEQQSTLSCMSNKQLVEGDSSKHCRPRALCLEDEFFLVLVRLRLGPYLADRFEISVYYFKNYFNLGVIFST